MVVVTAAEKCSGPPHPAAARCDNAGLDAMLLVMFCSCKGSNDRGTSGAARSTADGLAALVVAVGAAQLPLAGGHSSSSPLEAQQQHHAVPPVLPAPAITGQKSFNSPITAAFSASALSDLNTFELISASMAKISCHSSGDTGAGCQRNAMTAAEGSPASLSPPAGPSPTSMYFSSSFSACFSASSTLSFIFFTSVSGAFFASSRARFHAGGENAQGGELATRNTYVRTAPSKQLLWISLRRVAHREPAGGARTPPEPGASAPGEAGRKTSGESGRGVRETPRCWRRALAGAALCQWLTACAMRGWTGTATCCCAGCGGGATYASGTFGRGRTSGGCCATASCLSWATADRSVPAGGERRRSCDALARSVLSLGVGAGHSEALAGAPVCTSFAIFSGGAKRGTSGVTTVSAPCRESRRRAAGG